MHPDNKALIAGLQEAIRMVEQVDQRGAPFPGGFVVLDEQPWVTTVASRMVIGEGPALPFGSRTKGGH